MSIVNIDDSLGGEEEVECDCRGMTEGFLLQSFFQSVAGVLHS